MGWCGVEAAAHLWSRAEQQSRPLWSSRAGTSSSSSSIAGSPAPLSRTLRGVHISDQDRDIFIFFFFLLFFVLHISRHPHLWWVELVSWSRSGSGSFL